MSLPEIAERKAVLQIQADVWSIAAHGVPIGQAEAENVSAAVPLSTGAPQAVALFAYRAEASCTPVVSTLAVPGWHQNSGWRIGQQRIRISLP